MAVRTRSAVAAAAEAAEGPRARSTVGASQGVGAEPAAAASSSPASFPIAYFFPLAIAMSSIALLVRVGTGLHPHSGLGDPPRYGDFEAQRHWMEITTNLPIGEWYVNSSRNDLQHWGLDYPPLSAYQSYVHGRAVALVRPASVALGSSVGAEDDATRALLRATVLVSDVVVYFPAALWAVYEIARSREAASARGGRASGGRGGSGLRTAAQGAGALLPALRSLALLLLSPALIAMDHGHFQYNCISLGLALAAIAAIVRGDRLLAAERSGGGRSHGGGGGAGAGRGRWLGVSAWHLAGSAFFSLSLNHKQISLFLAPAFFAHLLGTACRWSEREPTRGGGAEGAEAARGGGRRGWRARASRLGSALASVALLGAAVVATFALCWLPIYLADPPATAAGGECASPELGGGGLLSSCAPPSPSPSAGVSNALAVLRRVFPTSRGIFEDYVSNLWCATQPAFRWKVRLGGPRGPAVAAAVVLASAALPLAAAARAPSSRHFLLALLSSALAFYLFGYQVHEKSILLALLPAALLSGCAEEADGGDGGAGGGGEADREGRGAGGGGEADREGRGAGGGEAAAATPAVGARPPRRPGPLAASVSELAVSRLPLWLHLVSLFSLLPLIERDADLVAAAAACVALVAAWAGLAAFGAGEPDGGTEKGSGEGRPPPAKGKTRSGRSPLPAKGKARSGCSPLPGLSPFPSERLAAVLPSAVSLLRLFSAAGALVVVVSRRLVPAPPSLPYLHDLALSAFCFAHFLAAFLWASAALLLP